MPRRTDIAADEPRSTVRPLNDSMLATYQSLTVLARRFAVIEVHLLSFVKNDANFDKGVGSSAKHTLLIFTYLALFFYLSAVVGGHILMYGSGELPVRPPQERGMVRQGLPDSGTSDPDGVKRTSVLVMWHWVFSFIAGTVSLITQVLLYVWLEETNSVRITVSIITVFVILPLVYLIPLPSASGKRPSTIGS
ncbi:hypothetical protein EDB92DRAFT_1946359 [Lactarius akahatsu]|uniref:Transmembrane protein n=1 Tax=Lactarius akahatsu TaxID=416441 RepID=A0AAD4QAH3_9AGAM|nr:hypothetical protein EDB92DRAFT_1946359 [Lactarius akahatsu]